MNSHLEFLFDFFLVTARLGSMISVIPALGDERISIRIRFAFCLVTAFLFASILKAYMPKYSTSPSILMYYIISEMLVGLSLGICVRIYFSAIFILGNIISMQSGLSSALIYDPAQREQVLLFSSFISILALAYVFTSDAHHYMIIGFTESYERFLPGIILDPGDLANKISDIVNSSFLIAFKISAPFLIIGVAILIASGVLSRLMPTFQVFFVVTPAQILIMFCVILVVINDIVSIVLENMMSVF
ncbi:MAG: flagellar biosynthetic protein FliR [Rickettsiaceae bacterium]|nr:flagellar biosynthetic protein FliR [Rickettsiaceae bacterium]